MSRRELKEKSERASIETALRILHPLNYILGNPPKIVEKPNPPDAIIRIGNTVTWMEHTDAHRTNDEAREQWSYRKKTLSQKRTDNFGTRQQDVYGNHECYDQENAERFICPIL